MGLTYVQLHAPEALHHDIRISISLLCAGLLFVYACVNVRLVHCATIWQGERDGLGYINDSYSRAPHFLPAPVPSAGDAPYSSEIVSGSSD